MSKSSLEAAAEAAAKVNAMLIAKGKLKLFPSTKLKTGAIAVGRGGSGDLITAEVDINDAPLSARNLLTRGHTQDEICKYSGASISTRGRYMTMEERQTLASAENRPLYLHVQASSQDFVGLAVKRIQDIINQHVIASGGVKDPTVGIVTYPSQKGSGTVTPSNTPVLPTFSSGCETRVFSLFKPHYVQDKVFVGLENAPATYPVREKILGPGGSFLQHIRTETAATVTLRGKGSGFIEPTSGREAFEPLYIHITHPKLEGLQAAKALAINLVETTHVEYAQWQQQQSVLQPLTSVVIPQGAALAYQNQVLVTPALIPATANALVSSPSIVTARLPVSAASISGVALPLIQTSVSPAGITGATSSAVATSIPVSIQGITTPAVITYPTTYVANQSPVIARAAANVIGIAPRLSASTAYTVATSQPAVVTTQHGALPITHFAPSVQPLTFSPPLTFSTVSVSAAHLNQSNIQPSMVVATNAANFSAVPTHYVPTSPSMNPLSVSSVPSVAAHQVSTAYPHIQYPRFETERGKRKFCEEQEFQENLLSNLIPSLQESNSNPPTDTGAPSGSPQGKTEDGEVDRDLMPPPPRPTIKECPVKGSKLNEADEPDRKRLRGALIGIASVYGSDDSSDDEGPVGSPCSKFVSSDSASLSKSFASTHANKPLM